MPIQEALILSLGDLPRPSKVLFDPPCVTAAEDLKAWNALLPLLQQEWKSGREIMALIQTRNTRSWSSSAKNYTFKPEEDYLIAAYSLSPSLGKPYKPASCTQDWLDNQIAAQSGGVTGTGTNDMYQVFQCSSKGCNLSVVGVMKLIKFHQSNGKTSAEAMSEAKDSLASAQKFGWVGGVFPSRWMSAKPTKWVSAKPTGLVSS